MIQNIVFWWVIPAAYSLVRAESRSEIVAVSAAALVPLTPLLWPLVWNDFRELQLAAPFVLWAINGIRGRSVPLAALGITGMLACRQEFAVMVATFAILPPRARAGAASSWASRPSGFIPASLRTLFPRLRRGGQGGFRMCPPRPTKPPPPHPPFARGGNSSGAPRRNNVSRRPQAQSGLSGPTHRRRQPEPLDVTLHWHRETLLGGTIWLLFGFFAYLRYVVGRGASRYVYRPVPRSQSVRGRNLGHVVAGASLRIRHSGPFSRVSRAGGPSRFAVDLGTLQRAIGP